jgi:hemolysin activation/secretion protein
MKNKIAINLSLCLSLLISGKTLSSPDIAPVINPIDQEIINQKQKDIAKEAQKRNEIGANITLPKVVSSIDKSDQKLPCQVINTIDIEGSEQLSKSKQASLIKPYITQCLTIEDLNVLVQKISNAYLEKGFITSGAFIKEQDISKGKFTISVLEGKINDIQLEGEHPLTLKMVFPNMIGKTLNLRDIEQGIEQLDRMSSYRVKIDIQPTERPEYSDVVLKKISSAHPISANLGLDNSGYKSTGREQLNGEIQIENPLNLAEVWTISANKNSDFSNSHRIWNMTSGVSIPYGYWLFSYQYSKNDSFQDFYNKNIEHNYRFTGKSESHSIKANKTLFRDGTQKVVLNMGLTRRKTENKVGDIKFTINSPTLSSINVGLNYSAKLMGGYFSFNPSYSQGIDIFNAKKDSAQFKNEPKSQFQKINISSNYFKFITDDIYYLTSVYGQYNFDNLYASERLSLGGQYSVRGFKEENITGNRGGYWRNELNWKMITMPKLGELSLRGSLDTGWIKNEKDRVLNGGNLTGTALGITLNNNISNHSITIGKPLNYPKEIKPCNWVIYWSTSLNF